VRASGSYVCEAGGTGGPARVCRVEVMVRTGGEFHGDGGAVLPLDMVGSQLMRPEVEAESRRRARPGPGGSTRLDHPHSNALPGCR
jgi:hypothetical protein